MTVTRASFRSCTEAPTSRWSDSASGSRCLRQERDSTLNSISAHLANIVSLRFDSNVARLQAGDFDGLTGMQELEIYSNTGLSSLPAGIFDELTALTLLYLSSNALSSVPAGVFDQLTALRELHLSTNTLSSLPAGVFDRLTNLVTLDLHRNGLTSLSAGIFDELTALEILLLELNNLTTLPDNIFQNLTNLTQLGLDANPNSVNPVTFRPNANAGPDRTVLQGAEVALDGTDSVNDGPWGTNVTYRWVKTGGPDVTLSDAAAAMTAFTAPKAGDPIVFRLTVTGRGGDYRNTDEVAVTVLPTLVSNVGQADAANSDGFEVDSSAWAAQGFTADAGSPDGYTLSGIGVVVQSVGAGTVTPAVGVYDDNGGEPGALVHRLSLSGTLSGGTLSSGTLAEGTAIFTAPGGATLDAGAKYYVRFAASAGSYNIRLTGSNAEDSVSADGWSIEDNRRGSDGTVTATKLKVAVLGFSDEPGFVSITGLNADWPQMGEQLVATLDDANGGVTNLTWRWRRYDDRTEGWRNISGAHASTYTVTSNDVGRYLQAVASYDDVASDGNTASKTAVNSTAESSTLISNGDEDVHPSYVARPTGDVAFASSFTTGNAHGGYRFAGVHLNIDRSAGGTPKLSIYRSNNPQGWQPGLLLRELTFSSSSDAGEVWETLDPLTLAPNTTYFVVAGVASGGTYEIGVASAGGGESGDFGGSGFSVGDHLHHTVEGVWHVLVIASADEDQYIPVIMAVYGDERPLQVSDLTASSESEDCTDGTDGGATCRITMVDGGGAFYGSIHRSDDTDRVRVPLTSGTTYRIEVRPRKGVDRSLRCTTVTGIYRTDGALVSTDTRVPSRYYSPDADAAQSFTAPDSADFDIGLTANCDTDSISHSSQPTGRYSVIVLDSSVRRSVSEGDTDLPGNTSTTGYLGLHQTVTGSFPHFQGSLGGTRSDSDWFRMDLEAGATYRFPRTGIPAVTVKDEDGNTVWQSTNSQTFTPNYSGTYHLVAEYAERISSNSLRVAREYSVNLEVMPNSGFGTFIVIRWVGEHKEVRALKQVSATAATAESEDCADGNAGGAECSITMVDGGGAFYGNIDRPGDTDRVRVSLTSGTTYTIEVRPRKGVDRSLRCATVTGIYHTDGTLVSTDTSVPSRFFYPNASATQSFTAPDSADFDIGVTANCDTDGISRSSQPTGKYTVAVLDPSVSLSVPEGDTDLPGDTSTTGYLGIHQTVNGRFPYIPAGRGGTRLDPDWFRMDLEAGSSYRFPATGIPAVTVKDEDGTTVWQSEDAQTFTPSYSGTYYLVAEYAEEVPSFGLPIRKYSVDLEVVP